MAQESSHKKLDVLPVTLSGLAFACHVYAGMSKADKSYQEFLDATKPEPDLTILAHRTALITWLNKWGCRQFAKDDHKLASGKIKDWYEKWHDQLPITTMTLLELSDADLDSVCEPYKQLAERKASERKRGDGTTDVRFGPTGAAKILFAIRPQSLMPWDESIRTEFGLDESADSYIAFLKQVKTELIKLDEACKRNGHVLSELPKLLKRPDSSLVKLIDEYFWVRITKECQVPEVENLALWATWK